MSGAMPRKLRYLRHLKQAIRSRQGSGSLHLLQQQVSAEQPQVRKNGQKTDKTNAPVVLAGILNTGSVADIVFMAQHEMGISLSVFFIPYLPIFPILSMVSSISSSTKPSPGLKQRSSLCHIVSGRKAASRDDAIFAAQGGLCSVADYAAYIAQCVGDGVAYLCIIGALKISNRCTASAGSAYGTAESRRAFLYGVLYVWK